MKENIKIKIELFHPIIIETKYEELVYDKFLEMLKDILQSNITIEIDDKLHEIKASFKKEKGKTYRYYSTLVLEFEVDMEELYSRARNSFKQSRRVFRRTKKSNSKNLCYD